MPRDRSGRARASRRRPGAGGAHADVPVDADDWREVGRAHGEVFGEVRPASTMVVVDRLARPGVAGRDRSRRHARRLIVRARLRPSALEARRRPPRRGRRRRRARCRADRGGHTASRSRGCRGRRARTGILRYPPADESKIADAVLEAGLHVVERPASRVVQVQREPVDGHAFEQRCRRPRARRSGSATPIVSPTEISSHPSSSRATQTSSDRRGVDGSRVRAPEGGRDVAATPPARARRLERAPARTPRATPRSSCRCSARRRPREAAVNTATASAPARSARSMPRMFGTSTG